MRLENGKTSLIVKAGQACIFDTRRPWRFWKSANTSYRWVMLPKIPILQNTGGLRLADQPVLLDASKPEAKIAMSFLQQLKSQDLGRLSLSGIASTEEAASSLLAGAVSSANVLSSREFDSATLAVAQDFIDNNLECPELSPALIANAISVSVRTLHRAFSNAGSSAMGYVRMRRLQGARNDLLSSDPTEKISSIAAKWRFSDASHFIRQFKEVYGVTPSSYVREFRSNGGG
ncbi:helix-turn-helix domain-containing protein (plasmid) [Streptomyces sp. NBC_01707]|uniref:helix-turn-helix domain-containing protein n=1 Tax=Streptomyces sp. NBC_01707 TaxID=2975914 RepID=UPI00352CC5CC